MPAPQGWPRALRRSSEWCIPSTHCVPTNRCIPIRPDSIRKQLSRSHFDTLVAGYESNDQGSGDDITRLLRQRKVDGLVIFGQEISSAQIEALRNTGFPFLLVNPPPLQIVESCHHIRIDHHFGGYLAGQKLLEKAHRKLLCLSEASFQFQLRTQGFLEAIQESNIEWEVMLLADGLYETAYEFISLHIDTIRSFDGILVQSDISSIGVLNCLLDHYVPVPEAISIIGFDDIQWARYTRPSLTTVPHPRDEVTALATQIIMAEITEEAVVPIQKELKPVLVCRESC